LVYVPVEPDVVAEVEVDAAYEHGRWHRQTRLYSYTGRSCIRWTFRSSGQTSEAPPRTGDADRSDVRED